MKDSSPPPPDANHGLEGRPGLAVERADKGFWALAAGKRTHPPSCQVRRRWVRCLHKNLGKHVRECPHRLGVGYGTESCPSGLHISLQSQ